MARSRPDPPLRTPLGARFTVTRLLGHVSPLGRSAARTRSRASRHDASGRPDDGEAGEAAGDVDLDADGRAVTPNRVADGMVASMGALLDERAPSQLGRVRRAVRRPIERGRDRSDGV